MNFFYFTVYLARGRHCPLTPPSHCKPSCKTPFHSPSHYLTTHTVIVTHCWVLYLLQYLPYILPYTTLNTTPREHTSPPPNSLCVCDHHTTKRVRQYRHSGKWEFHDSEGCMMWSDTGSFDHDSPGDLIRVHNPTVSTSRPLASQGWSRGVVASNIEIVNVIVRYTRAP